MTMRAMGPFNGLLPQPTGQFIGYLRDPKTFPYLTYTQLVEAPEVQFMYWTMNSDEAARLPYLHANDWGYDDYRPTGKGEAIDGEWSHDRTNRYDFPYTLGNATQRVWGKAGINLKALYDDVQASKAALHRATRCVNALMDASWPANHTATLAALTGEAGLFLQDSIGTQLDSADNIDGRFLLLKRALNAVKKRIQKATKGVVGRQQLYAIIPPDVAEVISKSGEIFEAMKQSQFSKELGVEMPAGVTRNVADWNIPPHYAGFWLVVEDTVRVKINRQADGSIADVTSTSEVDYIFDEDAIVVASKPMALDGVAGSRSFSTLQCWHYNGEGRVEAFSEPKHDLIDSHYVMEDKVVTPSLVSGFKITGVLD